MGREDDDWLAGDGDSSPIGGDPLWLRGLTVPDDLSALDGEVRALRRERRVSARRRFFRRALLAERLGRPETRRLRTPVIVVALLLVAGFAGLLMMFQPRRSTGRPAPLANSGVRPVGQEGGLLPDLTVQGTDGKPIAIRETRPAVVALVPADCACGPRLRDVGLAALRYHVAYVLVGRELPVQPSALGGDGTTRAADPRGALLAAYDVPDRAAVAPVLLLVRSDGVVNRVVADEPSPAALETELAVLTR